ncbi:MAG: Fascin domain [Bacteroidetes bacterium]|nr:Fascin domain [Bacteroidota bacterium]
MYGEYQKLPRGTIIGRYWDVYLINSVAIDSLQSLPFEGELIRNYEWRNLPLKETNFYLLNNGKGFPGGLTDIVFQHGFLLKNSGIKYICNGTEVLLYHKLYPIKKFIIKAANNQYVSVDSQTNLLTANKSISEAEVFELTATMNGTALKASNGKFVSADLAGNGNLAAKSDNANGWEIFQIIEHDGKKISLRTTNDKFVSANLSDNAVMTANRDKASDWEIFQLEPR